jgi:hypothetical protein
MIHFTHLHLGGTFGILYRFPRRGDGLPLHSHGADTEHKIQCTSGRVRVTVKEPSGVLTRYTLRAGGTLDSFDERAPHEIMALEDGSSCLNVFKHGQPPGYASLPLTDREGSAELGPLTYPLRGSCDET